MSFDRASAFYMGACQILRSNDATPGERAIAYACLAQVEALVSLAGQIERAFPAAGTGTQVYEAEDVLAHQSRALIEGIYDRLHEHGTP